MELVSGLLLWIAEILGIKWVRQEKNGLKKAARAVIFLAAGILLTMVFFVIYHA
jgi:hypothetical protein